METSYLFCICIGLSTLGAMSVAEVHRHGGNDVCYTANLQWDSIGANTFTLLLGSENAIYTGKTAPVRIEQ